MSHLKVLDLIVSLSVLEGFLFRAINMASLIYMFANLHSKMVQIFDEIGAVRDDRKCFYAKPFSSTEQGMYTEGNGTQISISGATTTGRLNFVTWRLIILGPMYGICLSPFWHLEF